MWRAVVSEKFLIFPTSVFGLLEFRPLWAVAGGVCALAGLGPLIQRVCLWWLSCTCPMWWLRCGSSTVSLCTACVRVVQPDRWWMGERSYVGGWALWCDVPRWLHTYPKFWELRCLLISPCPKVSNRSPFPEAASWERPVDNAKQNLKFGDLETEVKLEEAHGFSLLAAFLPGKDRIKPYAGVHSLALSMWRADLSSCIRSLPGK